MPVFNFNEHRICMNYHSHTQVGFKYAEMKKGETLSCSQMKHHHLFFIMKGSVNASCDMQKKTVEANSVFLVPAFSYSDIQITQDAHIMIHMFDHLAELCDKFALTSLKPFCEKKKYEFASLPLTEPFLSFLHLLRYYLVDQMLCRHMFDLKHKELFLLFRAFYSKEDCSQIFYPLVKGNINFVSDVKKNYKNVKTIEELANICNLSLPTFNRKFKQNFNTSPYKWILEQKINAIKSSLLNQDKSIYEIADELNFSSPAHLTTFCKVHLKMTPTDFRRKYAIDGNSQ